ncbi:MAG: integrase [Fluviicola sp.]|nr:MAG: integrase [Fluviicola sp.]
MASLKYRVKGTKDDSSIYVRLSAGRGVNIECKTGFVIKPRNWKTDAGYPKQSTPELKNLFNKLKTLEAYTYDAFNEAQGNGDEIDKHWLEGVIASCFDRTIRQNENLVTIHVQHIIDNAASKKIPGRNTIGLSHGRVKAYKVFKKNFTAFGIHVGKQIQLIDLNARLIEKFKKWLLEHKKYSVNYSGKNLDNLKAIVNDARKAGKKVHPDALNIESFTESNEDRHIVTLSFDEIERIKKTDLSSAALINARKWLVLGCELGQRVGDLLSIKKSNIRREGDFVFVDILQQKTGKEVTIPLASKEMQDLILKNPPYPISQQKLNQHIKDLCKSAEINELCKGKILDKKINRKVYGKYPKYELITTHTFRRSFATNYYKKMPTPVLMTITGHSKESMFLKYINRQEDKDENARLFLKYYNELNK